MTMTTKMSRRSFISGLLTTTAAVAVGATVASPEIVQFIMGTNDWSSLDVNTIDGLHPNFDDLARWRKNIVLLPRLEMVA